MCPYFFHSLLMGCLPPPHQTKLFLSTCSFVSDQLFKKKIYSKILLYILFSIFVTLAAYKSFFVSINALNFFSFGLNFIFCKLIKLARSLNRSILVCDFYVTLSIRFLMYGMYTCIHSRGMYSSTIFSYSP